MMQTTSSLDRMLDNVMLNSMSSGELAIGSSPHGCGRAIGCQCPLHAIVTQRMHTAHVHSSLCVRHWHVCHAVL